jgi:hypothetical protein
MILKKRKKQKERIYRFQELQIGMEIEAKEKQIETYDLNLESEEMGRIASESEIKLIPEVARQYSGKIIDIDYNNEKVLVQMPDGAMQIVEWINFAIWILPKVITLWGWIKSLFTRKKQ